MGSVKDEGGAAQGVDPAVVSTEHLLRSSAWQARLEEARRQREKVLAERAGQAEPLVGPKPWERRSVARPADLAARRSARATPAGPAEAPSGDPQSADSHGPADAKRAVERLIAAPAPSSAAPATRPAAIPQPTLVDPTVVDNGHAEAMFAAMRTARLLRQSPAAPKAAAQVAVNPVLSASVPAVVGAASVPVPPTARPARRSLSVVAGAFAFGLAMGLGVVFVPEFLDRMRGAGDAVPATISSTAPATFSSTTAQPAPLVPATAAPLAPAPEAPAPAAARPLIQPDTPITDLSAQQVRGGQSMPPASLPVPQLRVAGLPSGPAAEAPLPLPSADRRARPTRSAAPGPLDSPARAGDPAPAELPAPGTLPAILVAAVAPPPAAAIGPLPLLPGSAEPALPTPLPALAAPDGTPDPAPLAAPIPPAPPAGLAFAGTSVTLLVPARTPTSERGALSDRLARAGFGPALVKDVDLTIRATHVRYYHAADADAALALADAMEGEARDFTDFRKPPPGGTIELWIASGPPGPEAVTPTKPAKVAKKQRAAPRAPSEQDQVEALKARIVARLRNGDHL